MKLKRFIRFKRFLKTNIKHGKHWNPWDSMPFNEASYFLIFQNEQKNGEKTLENREKYRRGSAIFQ